jgi:hypothetical protein
MRLRRSDAAFPSLEHMACGVRIRFRSAEDQWPLALGGTAAKPPCREREGSPAGRQRPLRPYASESRIPAAAGSGARDATPRLLGCVAESWRRRTRPPLEGLICAQLGGPDAARQAAHRALETTQENYVRMIAGEALGQLELALGAPDAVVAHLEPMFALARAEAIAEPGATRFTVDLIEALVELGRRDEALEILDWYEGNARRLQRFSALANCRRLWRRRSSSHGSGDSSAPSRRARTRSRVRDGRPSSTCLSQTMRSTPLPPTRRPMLAEPPAA